MEDPTADHPSQLLIFGSAGTCVVFNSHLWHSGTTNNSNRPRRALHATLVQTATRPNRHHKRDFLRPGLWRGSRQRSVTLWMRSRLFQIQGDRARVALPVGIGRPPCSAAFCRSRF